MSNAFGTLGIDRMSVAERLELMEEIWESIPDTPETLELADWHREELERRLASADADPTGGISWDEFKKQFDGKF